MSNPQKIIDLIEHAIRRIYDQPEGVIPLHAPFFRGSEWKYVQDCIDSGWVSSVGNYVKKFEKMITDYTRAQYAVATVNGTAAIHIALLLDGVQEENEILCPAFSFVGTISPVLYCNAYPVFFDSDSSTLGIDVIKVKRFLSEKCIREKDGYTYNKSSGRKIKACIPMHSYGYPVDMESLLSVCKEYNISVIEDAAEALGSVYKGKHCGTLGKIGALSFNGNKIITTGGGGMILTNDQGLAKRAKHLTTTAKLDHPWEYIHDEVGYNYRMPNINAALGCAQIERLPQFLRQKRTQAEKLNKSLNNKKNLEVIQPQIGNGNHWFNLIKIDPKYRDDVLKGLNDKGIQARASWNPLCDMKPYARYEQFEIKAARELSFSLICLPNGVSGD